MTTGKYVKLIAYINYLSRLMEKSINFYNDPDDDGEHCRRDMINVNAYEGSFTEYVNLIEYRDVTVSFDRDYEYNIETILKELSGDINAKATLRAEFASFDTQHKKPEYKICIDIDNTRITIDANGWR